ncbi:hypothetical protein [Nocardia wallacei]|uniref:hypothetical protein n=1 Tax=Nocardia wallacei TaxID=480035 RepID=UPI0024558C05|nr:hypothetical protein [Nocardia wallacei]
MNEALSLGNLLVGGGLSAVVVALIGAVFGRRMRQADYARALVETADKITVRADQRAEVLEAKVGTLETKVDRLDERVDELSGLIREAIPLLAEAGHFEMTQKMRNALVRGA